MEANVSDELIEAMARCIHAELSRANVMAYLDMPDTTPETLARALLPVIRAHLEPTSEMVQAAMDCGPIGCCNISSTEARDVILAALAASPIGDVG
jgi:hypothetical protein